MAWVPVQESSVLHSLVTDGVTGGSVTLTGSHLVGVNAEAGTPGDYTCQLLMPTATQVRITPVSFSCANPNPIPGTPDPDYLVAGPVIEWAYLEEEVGFSSGESYPFNEHSGAPWPADAPEVVEWLPSAPVELTIGVTSSGSPGLYLYNFGRYDRPDFSVGPVPTDFSFLIEVWDEGDEPPVDPEACFWTDLVVAREDCVTEPSEYPLTLLAGKPLGSAFRTAYTDWCEPAFTLLSDAQFGGTVELTRVWPITNAADDPLTFDFCGDLWDNPGITPITDLSLDDGALALESGDGTWSRSFAFAKDAARWQSYRCLVELTVDGTERLYGLYDGIF